MKSLLWRGSIPILSTYDSALYKDDVDLFYGNLRSKGIEGSIIVQNYAKILKQLNKNYSLNNPESVLNFLAAKDISDGRKELIVDCCANYYQWKKLPFVKVVKVFECGK